MIRTPHVGNCFVGAGVGAAGSRPVVLEEAALGTQLTLGLKKGGKWPTPSDPAAGGQTLYLMTLKKDGSDESLLSNPVPVATVMVTPSVQRGFDKVVYMTGTKKLNINGTGFKAKSTQLVFDPPLVKDVDYLLNTRSSTMMQLTLRTGRKWRSDGQPGPLKLRRINTGAGFLRIDAKYGGVTVAEVQVDLVYLIGLVFCCGGLTYVVVQKNSGKSVWSAVPTLDPATLDPKSSVQMKKLAVTPDTTYSGSA